MLIPWRVPKSGERPKDFSTVFFFESGDFFQKKISRMQRSTSASFSFDNMGYHGIHRSWKKNRSGTKGEMFSLISLGWL